MQLSWNPLRVLEKLIPPHSLAFCMNSTVLSTILGNSQKASPELNRKAKFMDFQNHKLSKCLFFKISQPQIFPYSETDQYIPCKNASVIWLGLWHTHFAPVCADCPPPPPPPWEQIPHGKPCLLDMQAPSNLHGSDTLKLTLWPCTIDVYPALPLLMLSSWVIREEGKGWEET